MYRESLLDSKISRVTPIDRPLEPFDNKAVRANRKFTCRSAWNPKLYDGDIRATSPGLRGSIPPSLFGGLGLVEEVSGNCGVSPKSGRKPLEPGGRDKKSCPHSVNAYLDQAVGTA